MLLEMKNVSKSYKKKQVLSNINLSICEKEIVALVGPNGAGKTTLMKIISGLLEQDSGSVTIGGITEHEDWKKYYSSFSCIIETPSLYEMLSGYDNINFIAKIHNCGKEKLDEIIDFINIGDAIRDKVKNYSLGMKQRLALGIALVTEPKLLILDEPTNGLDPEGVIEFRRLLEKCVKEKEMSVLISSHILSELEKICSRIVFLKDGKLLEMDSFNKTNEDQIVILEVDDPEKVVSTISGEEFISNIKTSENNKVVISMNKKNTAKLMSVLAVHNIDYSDISINKTTIESVYKATYLGENTYE